MRKQEEYCICWVVLEALQSGCCVTTLILGVSPESLKGFISSLWRRCWVRVWHTANVYEQSARGNAHNTWDVIQWCFCAGFWQICLLLFEHCLSFHHMGCHYQASFSRYACNTNKGNFQRHKRDSHAHLCFWISPPLFLRGYFSDDSWSLGAVGSLEQAG